MNEEDVLGRAVAEKPDLVRALHIRCLLRLGRVPRSPIRLMQIAEKQRRKTDELLIRNLPAYILI